MDAAVPDPYYFRRLNSEILIKVHNYGDYLVGMGYFDCFKAIRDDIIQYNPSPYALMGTQMRDYVSKDGVTLVFITPPMKMTWRLWDDDVQGIWEFIMNVPGAAWLGEADGEGYAI
ncbi:hypothetical protein OEA41_003760 [Lepraria neglecta]|uniref:Uncharacterized protein n=1 Tax=Lepraria neglecta TaxID=209136 RepID=A0AAD9Z5A0_9LECA|nr:hypothetical protein OEA41_003760 [Lepraria neglecta]